MKPETAGPTAVMCWGRIFPCRVTSFCATAIAAAVTAGRGGGAGCRRPRHTTTPTARANSTKPTETGIHLPRISLNRQCSRKKELAADERR